MSKRPQTKKFTLTVEGETEQWYFEWLMNQINAWEGRSFDVSITAKVQQSPKRFYKGLNAKTTPKVFHICDMESNEPVHVEKFTGILSEMKEAKTQKKITYVLGYSNYAFELWMVLHKMDCNGPKIHRRQYLEPIRQAFGEQFEDLDHYKKEDAFKRCLGKLTLNDVKAAVARAEIITQNNENDKPLTKYKGYSYYPDNPALSIHEVVREILEECGVLPRPPRRERL